MPENSCLKQPNVRNIMIISKKKKKQSNSSASEFRKLPPEGKLKGFGSLLKSYQEEIDRLTRRGAFAEKAFLSLYKSLSEIPDPVAGLNLALVRVHCNYCIHLIPLYLEGRHTASK